MTEGDFLGLILTKDTCLQGFGAVSTLRATCWLPCTLCLIQQGVHTWSWTAAWYMLVSARRLGQSRRLSRDGKNAHSRVGLLRWMSIQTNGVKSMHICQKTPRSPASLSSCLQDIFLRSALSIAPCCQYRRKAPCHIPKLTGRLATWHIDPFP